MKNYLIPILFVAIVVLFFVGRWTAPKPEDPRLKAEVEQLTRDKAYAYKLLDQAIDSMKSAHHMAIYYRNKATVAEMDKILTKKQYEASIRRIDRYTPSQIDSDLFKRYGRLYQDSLLPVSPGRP